MATAMLEVLHEPTLVDEAQVGIDASIGIALARGQAGDPGTLLPQADVAMYDQGRSQPAGPGATRRWTRTAR